MFCWSFDHAFLVGPSLKSIVLVGPFLKPTFWCSGMCGALVSPTPLNFVGCPSTRSFLRSNAQSKFEFVFFWKMSNDKFTKMTSKWWEKVAQTYKNWIENLLSNACPACRARLFADRIRHRLCRCPNLGKIWSIYWLWCEFCEISIDCDVFAAIFMKIWWTAAALAELFLDVRLATQNLGRKIVIYHFAVQNVLASNSIFNGN